MKFLPTLLSKKNKQKNDDYFLFLYLYFLSFISFFASLSSDTFPFCVGYEKRKSFFFFSLLCDTLEVTLSHSIFTSFFVSFACNTILYSFICCVYFVGDAFFLSRGINTSEIDAKLFCFLFLLLCVQVYK